MRRLLTTIPLVLAFAAGCGGDDDEADTGATAVETAPTETQPETTAAGAAGGCTEVARPEPKPDGGEEAPTSELATGEDYRVTFETNCGSFTVDVDEAAAGLTAASFVQLAESGFYDDTHFHRIVPGFVIQGGDPTGSGQGGPGYTTEDAPPQDAEYTKGTVAMAKAPAEPPGTAGSQFFVVTDDAAADLLTPDYAIVGEISAGMRVIDRIAELGDVTEQPTQVVRIERATVEGG